MQGHTGDLRLYQRSDGMDGR